MDHHEEILDLWELVRKQEQQINVLQSKVKMLLDRSAAFKPPTVEEVAAYCEQRENQVDPREFVDHYQANGWVRGKAKIKDWKACVRTWEKNGRGMRQAMGKSSGKGGWGDSPAPSAGTLFD